MEDLEKKKEAFAELLEVIATLRVECPWDRKQTMESLRALSIEEVYELGDAILAGDMAEVKKELGDLLMHIVFYAQIGSEKGAFDITDVLNSICEKLKYRHTHIYGGVKVDSAEEVLDVYKRQLLYVRDWRMVLLAILRTNHGDGAIVRKFRTIAPSP